MSSPRLSHHPEGCGGSTGYALRYPMSVLCSVPSQGVLVVYRLHHDLGRVPVGVHRPSGPTDLFGDVGSDYALCYANDFVRVIRFGLPVLGKSILLGARLNLIRRGGTTSQQSEKDRAE